MSMWMLRSLGGDLLPEFIGKNIVALGWGLIGDLHGKSRENIKQALSKEYPNKYKSIPVWASMLDNFANKMKIGDLVITYDSSLRVYHIAEITSDYSFIKKEERPNIRKVKWNKKTVSRDLLSITAKNYLGASQTLFSVTKEIESEFRNILEGKKIQEKTEDEKEQETEQQTGNLLENSVELLKDKILSLAPDDMEELAKEILNAMGYIARRTQKGSDRGTDVFASKDGLGLEEPRIFVEVKHREGQMGTQKIRSFMGGRRKGDKCLYISTGGFTKEAKYEADRSEIPLTLIDLNMLAELVTLHYDNFRAEGKLLLPLRKVYLPA
ncbi:MAG: restriction endonuclease [Alphaproteobacteria bacterium]|nr:restriction endonuclease [Alphaproteobacteria bacterium]